MSWSVSFSNKTVAELVELDADDNQLQAGLAREPFTEVRDALVEVLHSGVLGNLDGHFSGTMSGHVNENHEPLPGWSPDHFTLNCQRVREPSELDKAANAGS